MRVDVILEKAKRADEEKIGVSFKIPISLKKSFEEFCRNNNVSMTSLLVAFMEDTIDYDGLQSDDKDVNKLLNTITSMTKLIDDGVDEDIIGVDPNLVRQACVKKLKDLRGSNHD